MPIDWSAIDNRSIIGRLLRLPLRALPKRMVVNIRRGPAKGLKWIVGASNHGCWLGTYEMDKQQALMRFVRPDMTVYDIGSQAGFYTLLFSALVGGKGMVYACEPLPENLFYLLRHVQMNRRENVRVVQVALAERSGLHGFSTHRGRLENRLTDPAHASLLVSTLSLDDAVDRYGLQPPSLVKMDVEGAESRVLSGARQTIARHRPVLFVATHGEEQRQWCEAFLGEAEYEVYDLAGRRIAGHLETDEVYALAREVC
jgi:FkbM family methyltransferase